MAMNTEDTAYCPQGKVECLSLAGIVSRAVYELEALRDSNVERSKQSVQHIEAVQQDNIALERDAVRAQNLANTLRSFLS